jgi:hypothetical protein
MVGGGEQHCLTQATATRRALLRKREQMDMHAAASHTFQYPKVTPVAPAGTAKPGTSPSAGGAGGAQRPQR